MIDWLGATLDWMRETDLGTWVAHWLQGFGFAGAAYGMMRLAADGDLNQSLLAAFLVDLGIFGHREAGNLWDAADEIGWREAIRRKLRDGWMDLAAPVLGFGTFVALLLGGLFGFTAGVVASAIFIAIAHFGGDPIPS